MAKTAHHRELRDPVSPAESPLLSPAASSRVARELRSWGAAEQAQVRRVFHRLYTEWRADWAVDGAVDGMVDEGVDGALAGAARETEELVGVSDIRITTALSDEKAHRLLPEWLFGDTPRAPESTATPPAPRRLSSLLADQAWADWRRRVAAACGVAADATTATADHTGTAPHDPFSGRLELAFAWARSRWGLSLEAEWVAHVLRHNGNETPDADLEGRARPTAGTARTDAPRAIPLTRVMPLVPLAPVMPVMPLVPVTQAMAQRRLGVRVALSSVTVDLGQLQALAVGDVVTLPHRLDQPTQVFLDDPAFGATPAGDSASPASPLCAAWLGQCQGHMAAELISSNETAPDSPP